MRRLAVLLVTVSITASCSSFSADTPPVPDSTMVDVLVELHLGQARAELYELPAGVEDSMLATYGVSRAELRATFDYYAEHPEVYDEVYSQVVDRLTQGQRRVRAMRSSPDSVTASP